mmetsp:Transcript_20194/g.61290  ORF Transcript_20194/g.61290 Transcript_20194/m.61290 type:complete len:222 (+) Transcript_20194:2496-3161(+)
MDAVMAAGAQPPTPNRAAPAILRRLPRRPAGFSARPAPAAWSSVRAPRAHLASRRLLGAASVACTVAARGATVASGASPRHRFRRRTAGMRCPLAASRSARAMALRGARAPLAAGATPPAPQAPREPSPDTSSTPWASRHAHWGRRAAPTAPRPNLTFCIGADPRNPPVTRRLRARLPRHVALSLPALATAAAPPGVSDDRSSAGAWSCATRGGLTACHRR